MKLLDSIHTKINHGINLLPQPFATKLESQFEAPLAAFFENYIDKLGNPVAWQAPKHQPLRGKYKKNTKLADLKTFVRFPDSKGPESIAIANDGTMYTGLHDGRIMQFDKSGSAKQVVCQTGGRPLGMRVHPSGDLLVCDTQLGLIKVALTGDNKGKIKVLTNSAEGLPFGFADDLDVSKDGRHVYFTDASSKWGYENDIFDHIEHGGHGRLLHFDMQTEETTVLMNNLCFANGVTLSPEEDFLLVTETGSYCVHRYWLKDKKEGNSKAHTHEVFIENLPGFPDNIRFNGTDTYWVAIPVARNRLLDKTSLYPALRFVAMQALHLMHPPIKHTAMVLGFDLTGKLKANLQDHGKNCYNYVTQAIEYEGVLYCSSLEHDGLSKLSL